MKPRRTCLWLDRLEIPMRMKPWDVYLSYALEQWLRHAVPVYFPAGDIMFVTVRGLHFPQAGEALGKG